MSYAFDANVLLFASDRSSPRHAAARAFLEACAKRPDVLCLTWPTLMAYARIATHPSIFAAPMTPEDVWSNISALVALPQARVVTENAGFLDAYVHVTADVVPRGNLVPDAHVATILFQHGVRTFYTNDRDFRKFSTLDVRDPFA